MWTRAHDCPVLSEVCLVRGRRTEVVTRLFVLCNYDYGRAFSFALSKITRKECSYVCKNPDDTHIRSHDRRNRHILPLPRDQRQQLCAWRTLGRTLADRVRVRHLILLGRHFVGYSGQFGWKYGIASTFIGVGNALIGSLLAWVILGRRTRVMTHHLDACTMPEFFEKRFDSKPLKSRRR